MISKKLVLTAFSVCIVFSILLASIAYLTLRDIKKDIEIQKVADSIVKTAFKINIDEREYRLNPYKKNEIKEHLKEIKKLVSSCEEMCDLKKINFSKLHGSIDLYEKLFEQLKFYHETNEKIIEELRKLERIIQATIFSKPNPEKGTIALLEIRLQEKSYMLFREKPLLFHEKPYSEKRKIAVRNLLMWAEGDKRINELMDKDSELFEEIVSNYEQMDKILELMKKEIKKIEDIGYCICKATQQKIDFAYKKLQILLTTLLVLLILGGIELIVFYTKNI
ncbi:MAG TPA: hypothetical protein ENI40_01705 [Candidatus Desulfofervidus auxilii]|nr:hypothetical protein [Candidatus Desulfofervidus auxilii]